MNVELQRFMTDLVSNEALRTAVKAAGSDHAAIVKVANENGYPFTLDDVNAVVASGELADTQLAGVAGGQWRWVAWDGGGFVQWT